MLMVLILFFDCETLGNYFYLSIKLIASQSHFFANQKVNYHQVINWTYLIKVLINSFVAAEGFSLRNKLYLSAEFRFRLATTANKNLTQ